MVFKGLLLEWFHICETSRGRMEELEDTLLDSSSDVDARNRNFDEIDKYCIEVYKRLILAGYKHLQTIQTFSDWEAVVAVDIDLLNK